jgi:hypothetical protein
MKELIPHDVIEQKIFMLRGQKVMLSGHLAELYGVVVKALTQAVKRNIDRFPKDFMFQLSDNEYANLKSQIVTSSWGGSRRSNPYAFTEQGVAMLSSVLRSKQAIQVNIAVMRAFVKLRQILFTHKELVHKLRELEHKIEKHDGDIQAIFDAIRQMMAIEEKPKRRIGFHP